MKRITFMVFRLILFVPYWFVRLMIYAYTNAGTEESRYRLIKRILTKANKAGRVTVVSSGVENLPQEMGYMIYPNHQGLYDTLAFFETDPHPFVPVMKREVTNTFMLKQVRMILRGITIDRDDVKSAMRTIHAIAEEVKKGRNYLIFSEGTRSRKGNQTLDFKGGSFKAAYYAKCPIVPVALVDCYKAFDTNSIAPVTIQIHYLPPIPYEEYKDKKTMEVASMVRGMIDAKIAEVTGGAA
ncbi:1-acyl-sn-glycerol-3-phosphate acyltransferase [Cuneatibacter sp. NSJ-177]|jgi:1-acyl-sn-glycerol-3-phosphate acyltransferase|uniref:lysophospholipid acyltransferase family protein n=1 Tax=Cuneatibacter sp. NSJ-177 TaxID=2931401 RepID=UPI001FD08719|nr:lysophospholipid acyltransferase family protein [Cuneatibacter sp. NSJ-177]MCJ7835014.1 1-acyl-sn-glycerol-3-phosphate acyltransferase [Cuneatibacter sp. NSJ-177]